MIGPENASDVKKFSATHRAVYGQMFVEKMEEAFGMPGLLTTDTISPTIIKLVNIAGSTAGLELRRLKFGGKL